MRLVIPRGIVYHKVPFDVAQLLKALVARLGDRDRVRAFEDAFARYHDVPHCVAFPYARTAIYHALKAQGFEPGSQIIMPPITIKAILDVVLDLGLEPVFVDIDPDTLCFDVEKVRRAVTPRTKAILVTYLFGIVPDLDALMGVCRDAGLFVIEDFSQCLNGRFRGKKVGTFGDVGVYSASSIKTLDTYGGGLLICRDDALHDAVRRDQERLAPPDRRGLIRKIGTDLVRNLATTRFLFHFIVFPLLRLAARFRPGSTLKHTGGRDQNPIRALPDSWFTAYTSLQAGVGLRLLPRVEASDRARRRNVETIRSLAPRIRFPKEGREAENVYWQLLAYFEEPEQAQAYLHDHGIDTSTTSLENIANLPAYPIQGDTPAADRLSRRGFFVPAYPRLGAADIEHIGQVLGAMPARLVGVEEGPAMAAPAR